jgi:hypothetical protein
MSDEDLEETGAAGERCVCGHRRDPDHDGTGEDEQGCRYCACRRFSFHGPANTAAALDAAVIADRAAGR